MKEQETITVEANSKEIIEQYLSDKSVQEKLDIQAIHLNEVSHGNWVTIKQLLKKSQIKKEFDLKMILDLLTMSKKAFAKKEKDVVKYKITLNKESRKMVLENQIEFLERSLKALQDELKELSK